MKPMIAVPLEEDALTAEELARACAVQTTWVVERVQSGLLGATIATAVTLTSVTTTTSLQVNTGEGLRFRSPDLMRARRLAALERDFDANPEMAALTADLIEEVEALRRRLRQVVGSLR